MFSADEIRTMLRELATTGVITSLSGASKSGSYARIDPMQMAIELRHELNRLTGNTTPSRIEQRLFEGGGMYPAT